MFFGAETVYPLHSSHKMRRFINHYICPLHMNKLKKVIVTGLISIPLVLGMPSYTNAENEINTNAPRAGQTKQDDGLRSAVLGYLSQPRFSNSDLMEQITGTKAELQMLDLGEGMVYLSIPERHFAKEILKELTLNPNFVEFGKTSKGKLSGSRIELGDYALRKPGNYFFRFPSDDFRVDQSDIINIPYRHINYSITMQELQDFADNNSIFGGYLEAGTGIDRYGRQKIIANHGAFVAKKGEKSLERLIDLIVGKKSSKEEKAQRLLDFVTKELKYDHSEANSNAEVLKRPNEVLMTGGSDCSGKVILYASLLEQTDVDYRMVYTDTRITVAVEGDYPTRNRLSFNLGDITYSMAETTAKGFQIGSSGLNSGLSIEDIKYIQRPGENSEIYDAKTGEALPFL